MAASLERAEPPPAKSDRALIAIKGFSCWLQTNATAALSMSIGVALNLELRNSLQALLSTKTLALMPLLTLTTIGVLGKQVEFTHPPNFKSYRLQNQSFQRQNRNRNQWKKVMQQKLKYLNFLCNFEVMLVYRNPEGVLPKFRSSIYWKSLLWLEPDSV